MSNDIFTTYNDVIMILYQIILSKLQTRISVPGLHSHTKGTKKYFSDLWSDSLARFSRWHNA